MTNHQFILTVREEDIHEIYSDKLKYQIFSKDNLPTLLLLLLFFILALVSVLKTSAYDQYLFLALCFIAGFGNQVIIILKRYLDCKKQAKAILTWIENLKKYKLHKIEFGDNFFKYTRDNEVYVYDIKRVKTTYRTDNHFYFMTLDNDNIILPIKAFENGAYNKFILAFDERNK